MADVDLSLHASPTPFAELNEVLWELTERAARILGDNFVGAYLQGSFAVGDADIHSDCDFLIPVRGPITSGQEAALRAMHDEIPTRPGHWPRHLEGSYPDRRALRGLEGLGRSWLFIDHGSRTMEWSTHCNTEVVRWSLRECGVTLTGPDPKDLVDPVSPDVLRAKMREYAWDFIADNAWLDYDVAWSQRYAVTSLCRILHTLETGRVTSKRAALLWAADHLERRWSGLIRQVLDDRQLGLDFNDPPRPGSVERTLAFAEYVKAKAGATDEAP
ncbi:aminoglycoside adenylyltransferase domain-containing protein [Streptomyces sp. NPDC020792]|uniref:aminoglycoside adenylyltransferase domain-containing protein n=1 Tax=Streptomyces sp. NPDC020792 TaxID=3365089 RepID=UPI0037952A67